MDINNIVLNLLAELQFSVDKYKKILHKNLIFL